MNRLLLFVLSIFWCMAGISANHPSSLLPLPQKYQFNGKKSSGELTVEEKYVSQIEGAKFQKRLTILRLPARKLFWRQPPLRVCIGENRHWNN